MTDLKNLSPQERVHALNARVYAGKPVTEEELRDALDCLRSDRSQAVAAKNKKITDKAEAAKKGEDLLNDF